MIVKATSYYRKYCFAFSLVELLIVMSLLSAFGFISYPYIHGNIIQTQTKTEIQQIYSFLNQAKQNAITHQQQVIVCPINSALSSKSLVGSSCGGNWNGELMAFFDHNSNLKVDHINDVVEVIEKSMLIRVVNRTKFKFSPLSNASNTTGRFTVCSKDDTPKLHVLARSLVISNVGRIREEKGQQYCQ